MTQAQDKRAVVPTGTTASEDDRRRFEDQAEKKKAQNRLAQRNYRQNVKRRIEESEKEKRMRIMLEQQNAAQAELIRAQASLLARSNQHGAWQSDQGLDEHIPTSDPQSLRPRQQLHHHEKPNYGNLDNLQEHFANGGGTQIYSNADDGPMTPAMGQFGDGLSPILSSLSNENAPSSVGTSSSLKAGLDSTSQGLEEAFSAARSDILNDMSLQKASQTEQPHKSHDRTSNSFSSVHESFTALGNWSINIDNPAVPVLPVVPVPHQQPSNESMHSSDNAHLHTDQSLPWREIEAANLTSSTKLTANLPSLTTTTINERIEFMIHTARSAGFESLEHTVSVLHTTTFEEGSTCSNAQRLGRLRRLPNLIDLLLLDSKSWTTRELVKFRESVLRAGESFLIQERCAIDHATLPFEHIHELLASASDARCVEVCNELQDQLPGLTSIITTILLHVAEQSGSVYQSRLVITIQIIIALAGDASLERIRCLITLLLTV